MDSIELDITYNIKPEFVIYTYDIETLSVHLLILNMRPRCVIPSKSLESILDFLLI